MTGSYHKSANTERYRPSVANLPWPDHRHATLRIIAVRLAILLACVLDSTGITAPSAYGDPITSHHLSEPLYEPLNKSRREPMAITSNEPQIPALASKDLITDDGRRNNPIDPRLTASRATAWSQGRTRYLFLEKDVTFITGAYSFAADRAVVKIEPTNLHDDSNQQLWLYLDETRPWVGATDRTTGIHNTTGDRNGEEPKHDHTTVEAHAPRLIVTAATQQPLSLMTDLLQSSPTPPQDPMIEDAIEQFMSIATRNETPKSSQDVGQPPIHNQALTQIATPIDTTTPRQPTTTTGISPLVPLLATNTKITVVKVDDENVSAPSSPPPPQSNASNTAVSLVPVAQGTVSFHADRIVYQKRDEGPAALLLLGKVAMTYQNHAGRNAVALTAKNAVLFIDDADAGMTGQTDLDLSSVRGVYLEDNVILTDGQYTIRAPRVYYDLAADKAAVLDAVFYTWSDRRQLPIYVRARLLRQEAVDRWSANDAILTTSEFAIPHFSIGASRLTLEHRTDPITGQPRYSYQAEDMVPRWGTLPVGYWPVLSGEAGHIEDLPLQRIDGSFSRQNGPNIETTWNLFALTGHAAPDGVEFLGQADYRGEHGPAAGLDLRYDLPKMWGQAEGYIIFRDNGDDELANRRDIEFEDDTRGWALWRHRHYLRDDWHLSLEFAYDSDETFLEEFFREQAEQGKPLETSIYLKNQVDDRAFTFLAQVDLIDFTAQTTTLQAPGYTVEKQPELGYFIIGRSLFDNRLTWFSENRLTRLRIRPGDDRPADRGFTDLQSNQLFGQPASQTFDAALRDAGVPTDTRLRFDSRQELTAPGKIGGVDFSPYLAGRITAYDDDFAEFSGSSNDDQIQLWGTLGFRAHGQVNRVYDRVHVPVLDLHRLRHVIEPGIDLYWAGARLNPEDFPVYDDNVEGIREGLGFRFSLRNRLQTQRGGVGRWRSVDWMVLDTDVIIRSSDADTATPIARFIGYRPEFSPGSNHLHSKWAWMVSDALAMAGELTFNMDQNRTAQWRLGASLQHTPRLSSFIDYAQIDPLSSRLLNYGFEYELTRKYHLRFEHIVDFGEDQSRNIEIRLERKLPRWRLIFLARIDELDDEQLFGLVLLPEGFGSSRHTARSAWETND